MVMLPVSNYPALAGDYNHETGHCDNKFGEHLPRLGGGL